MYPLMITKTNVLILVAAVVSFIMMCQKANSGRREENQNCFYASNSLEGVWTASYRKAMGLAPKSKVRAPSTKVSTLGVSVTPVRFTNLLFLDDPDSDTIEIDTVDSMDSVESLVFSRDIDSNPSYDWMKSALDIQKSIDTMSRWIIEKKLLYVSLRMPDEEASLIQSTVTSFTATTANEIESLRKLLSSELTETSQQFQHRTGIVQILLSRLKEEIAEPFGRLQRQRARAAIGLWQNPLECILSVHAQKSLNGTMAAEGSAQRFCPSALAHRLHANFLMSYQNDERVRILERPASTLLRKRSAEFGLSRSNEATKRFREEDVKKNIPSPLQQKNDTAPAKAVRFEEDVTLVPRKLPMQDEEDRRDTFDTEFVATDDLQQEAIYLNASLHNDLESVEKMEQMMVDITALLTQFSELVSEQQENVYEIRDATATAKQNMQAGQEQLLHAKERTQESSHYMAKTIFALALFLLFFDFLRP